MNYVIRSGDTLSALARRYGTTVQALAQANGISNPDRISAGATISIPDGSDSPPPPTGSAPMPRPRPEMQGPPQPGPMPRPNPMRGPPPIPRPRPDPAMPLGASQGPVQPGMTQGPTMPGPTQGPSLLGPAQGPTAPGMWQGPQQLPGNGQPAYPDPVTRAPLNAAMGPTQGPTMPGMAQGPTRPGMTQGPTQPGDMQGPLAQVPLPDLAAAAQASNDPAELAAISQEIAARQVQTQSIQPTQAQQMGGQFGFAPVKNMDAPPVAPWDMGGPGPGQVQPPAGANGGLFVPTTGTDMGRFSTPRTGGLPMSTRAMGDPRRPQPVPGYGPGPGDPQMAPNPATDWASPPPPIPGEVPFTGAGDRNFIPQGQPGQFGLESEPGTMPVMGQGEGNPIMQMLIQLLSEGGGSPANRQLIPMLIQQLSAQGAR